MQVTASLACAALVALAFAALGQRSWPIAVPFVALWVLSPLAARWASRPPPEAGHLSVTPADALALRLVARRTWRFFDRFVTAADHMLPPDNFQEDPAPVIAHRTSPTNIGLYLLSVIAARDFGWLGTLDAIGRLEATFATMAKLDRFRGHFYNWYDTADLRALEPHYVSSVDSGNLAGHLIALGNACREISAGSVGTPNWRSGLADTLALVRDAAAPHTPERAPPSAAAVSLQAAIDAFAAALETAPSKPPAIAQHLADLTHMADVLVIAARAIPHERDAAQRTDIVVWAEALLSSALAHQHDFDLLVPWAGLLGAETVVDADTAALLETMPTLAALPGHSAALSRLLANRPCSATHEGRSRLLEALEKSVGAAQSVTLRLAALANLTETCFKTMEFGFLFDPERQLLSIGYRGGDGSLDANFYDLLASEARLASFVAIAKGDVPAKHWFRLGRTLTPIDGGSRPDLLVRIDVRISHAVAGHARAGRQPPCSRPTGWSCGGRRITAPSSAFPGACRNRNTTPATSSRPINIRASAFPISATSAGWRKHRHRALCQRPRRHGRSRRRGTQFQAPGRHRRARRLRLVRGARLYTRAASPKARSLPSSTPIWRIIRR